VKSVQIITGTGVPLKRSDVDTDQIIPAVWLKQVERTGFEKGLFSAWRDEDVCARVAFVVEHEALLVAPR
jgi:3-isopropylmalate/(R)-2-methylmalate dehydratase small subunit